MKLGVLYSGGKDSTLALMKAKEHHDVVCLITLVSENTESYMFHTPNIHLTKMQAEAMNLPLVSVTTKGEKEKELEDLKKAIFETQQKHKIDGVVTGAVRSTYQAGRIQQICHELKLWCFNPLWLMDQVELLNQVVDNKICAFIGGIFAEALDKDFLGMQIDKNIVGKLSKMAATHHINPAGEGGEIETTVIDAPVFQKKIKILNSKKEQDKHCGTYQIIDAKLEAK